MFALSVGVGRVRNKVLGSVTKQMALLADLGNVGWGTVVKGRKL